MKQSLIISNIEKSFGSVKVLRGISREFAPGTVTALVGDNGAGKSTLCKIISGVIQPDSGEIRLADTKLNGRDPREIRALGVEMIYQDLALVKQQNVVTNLYLGRELAIAPFGILRQREMRIRARELLAEVGISVQDLNAPVGTLSGGQQQSVAIARALLFSPKVLILDEPTAALAVKEIDHVLRLIQDLKSRGIVVILVSHRLNDIFEVSDSIVTLRAGRIVCDDLVADTTIQRVVESIVGGRE